MISLMCAITACLPVLSANQVNAFYIIISICSLKPMRTLTGDATLPFSFLPPSQWESTRKGKNLLSKEQIPSLKSCAIQESKGEDKKLFLFVKMVEKPNSLSTHLFIRSPEPKAHKVSL